jgi:sigma-B regulation protein RsbU (phosphoserine phosphatase)
MALLILAFIGGVNYFFLKKELLYDATVKTKLIEENSVHQIHQILAKTKDYSLYMKRTLLDDGFSLKNIKNTFNKGLEEEPNFYGMAMAFEPGIIYNKKFCPYVYRNNNTIAYKDLVVSDKYDYLTKEWYTTPKHAQEAKWSEPYFDEGGANILMATYGTPIIYKDKFAGIVTIDISLEYLQQIISAVHILKSGYAFLLSKDYKILVHPNTQKIMTQYRHDALKFNEIIQKENKWIYYAPVASTGLILGIVLPENELFASLNKISLISIILAIIGSILLIITMVMISRRITQPLKEVTALTQEISLGNFEKKIELPRTKDEIYYLASSVNRMQDSIKHYINDLKEATIKEERVESELNIAKSIQMSMLPKALEENPYISIAATLKPAKAVGGDFYDYFYIDEDQLCFVIADVSGKGVPAAMFMSVTMSYIRAYSSKQLPSKIVKRVNNTIAKNNDANMFVTLFLGILDVKSGKFTYVNAGHTSPCIIDATGSVEELSSSNNPVVGAFEGLEYHDHTCTLRKEEKLFLYTDGVTEAFSESDEQFGEQKLKDILSQQNNTSADSCIDTVQNAITEFAGACEQSDDITILILAKK